MNEPMYENDSPQTLEAYREARAAGDDGEAQKDEVGGIDPTTVQNWTHGEQEDDEGEPDVHEILNSVGISAKDVVYAYNLNNAKRALSPLAEQEWWDEEQLDAQARMMVSHVESLVNDQATALKDNPEFSGIGRKKQKLVNLMVSNPYLTVPQAFMMLKANDAVSAGNGARSAGETRKGSARGTTQFSAHELQEARRWGLSVQDVEDLEAFDATNIHEYRQMMKKRKGR